MDNFNNYSREQFGKIFSFDGEAGIIVTENNEYPFSIKDVYNKDDLVKGDIVTFRVNHLPFGNEVIDVAKFIKKDDLVNKRLK